MLQLIIISGTRVWIGDRDRCERICNQPVWKQVNTRDILVVSLIMLMMLSIGRFFDYFLTSQVSRVCVWCHASPPSILISVEHIQHSTTQAILMLFFGGGCQKVWNFEQIEIVLMNSLGLCHTAAKQTVELHQHHHNFSAFSPHTLILGENMRKWFNLHINLLSQHNNLWLE